MPTRATAVSEGDSPRSRSRRGGRRGLLLCLHLRGRLLGLSLGRGRGRRGRRRRHRDGRRRRDRGGRSSSPRSRALALYPAPPPQHSRPRRVVLGEVQTTRVTQRATPDALLPPERRATDPAVDARLRLAAVGAALLPALHPPRGDSPPSVPGWATVPSSPHLSSCCCYCDESAVLLDRPKVSRRQPTRNQHLARPLEPPHIERISVRPHYIRDNNPHTTRARTRATIQLSKQ